MKRRPALILSGRAFNQRNGHSIMAMITSAKASAWHLDTPFDWAAAGLPQPCIIRLKMATLDNRVIVRKIGKLLPADWTAFMHSFRQTFA
jgi:mRNA interferase MazF